MAIMTVSDVAMAFGRVETEIPREPATARHDMNQPRATKPTSEKIATLADNPTLYVIDVYSLLYQVFHAIPPMTSPSGQPTNAIFGFARDILKILREKKPTHLVCAMDSHGPAVRNEWYPDYKANRSPMPEDLRPQIPLLKQVLDGFGISVVEHAGWEADDVLATLARQAAERGMNVCLVTADKDARQLLSPRIRIYNARKDEFYTEENLQKEWSVRPDQVVDFQGLVGDSTDNIPGVPMVGPKKAAGLLEQFGSLDAVLEHADEVKGAKLKQNLQHYAEQALVSRRLATLYSDLPLEFDDQAFQVGQQDVARLRELFADLGFRRLRDEIAQLDGDKASEATSTNGNSATDGNSADPQAAGLDWKVIDTPAAFEAFLKELAQQPEFCVDLETTSLQAARADIVGWAISWQDGRGVYIPVDGPSGQQTLKPEDVCRRLQTVLENPDVRVNNQNIKYDLIVLRRAGVANVSVGVDPMVGSYLLNAGMRAHNLDALAERYLDRSMIPISDLIGKGKQQLKMFEVDVKKAAEYAAEDAAVAWELSHIIADELRRENLWDLYWDLERPLIPILADMKFRGIRVDTDELKRQSVEVTSRLEQLVAEIHQEAGHEFNIDSPLQLRVVLFDELNLPVFKKTKTGPSTDQSVLEKLALLHPLPAKIMEHRQLSKLKGTYLDALPQIVNPETGRIHASFNQVVAATGRLSSSDPNLQNIPVRTAEGRRIRKAFIAGDEKSELLCADYSQIELRILAHFCQDPALLQAFREGDDIHTSVAEEVFGVPADQVDKDMRRVSKAVNFGVIYGQSPYGLAETLGIPQDEAARFIDDYFQRFSAVEAWLDSVVEECARTGYAYTIMGRRREIQGIRLPLKRQRNMPERTAINTVIQGSAADLIKRAMIQLDARLKREQHPARLLLQIHDELVFETPSESVESLAAIVREEMTTAMDLAVPLEVDISRGFNWLEQSPLPAG